MIYRLYIGADNETGEVNLEAVHEAVGEYFEGYAVFEAQGVWKGAEEKSVVVEIVETDTNVDGLRYSVIKRIAETIKREANQSSVLVVQVPATFEMI